MVRSYIENGLFGMAQPIKMYYQPRFSDTKPSGSRLGEHHQFGVEVFGAKEPSVDAEIILMATKLFERLDLKGLELNINSIGCTKCRPSYHDALKDYLKGHLGDLCDTCITRYERNPLRILDCKNEKCGAVVEGAPIILDYLCEECSTHFNGLQSYLQAASVDYKINPLIVRGLIIIAKQYSRLSQEV